jgi:hypothetical protein
MKQAPWILCSILFAVILYLQMCQSKPTTVPKSDYDALKKASDDTVKYFNEIIKADDAAIDMATATAEQSTQRQLEAEDKVTESQGVIARLNAKIAAAKKEKPDSSFIAVSPRYVDGCDSLSLITGLQNIQVTMYKKENAALKSAKVQEIAARDKKLQDQQLFNDAMKKQLDSCLLKVKEKEQVKVKNQWYGEIGLIGNKVNPIGGGEAGISLINKKGVMYGVKSQLLAGQMWYGVKTGVRLFR